MKNLIKASSVVLALTGSSLFFVSCNSGNQNAGKDAAEDQNKTTFQDSKQDKNNAQFVVDVADANYDEIGLSNYAAKSSTNKDVKGFAEMMIKDHTEALNSLKTVAQKQNISIPDNDTAKVNAMIKGWQGKTPDAFNKAYINQMFDDHKATVDKLNKADTAIANADIHSWIEATLPVVREHFQKVSDLQKEIK